MTVERPSIHLKKHSRILGLPGGLGEGFDQIAGRFKSSAGPAPIAAPPHRRRIPLSPYNRRDKPFEVQAGEPPARFANSALRRTHDR